jgi:hypothetical protein
MKRHAEYGVDILSQISGMPRAAYISVVQHQRAPARLATLRSAG